MRPWMFAIFGAHSSGLVSVIISSSICQNWFIHSFLYFCFCWLQLSAFLSNKAKYYQCLFICLTSLEAVCCPSVCQAVIHIYELASKKKNVNLGTFFWWRLGYIIGFFTFHSLCKSFLLGINLVECFFIWVLMNYSCDIFCVTKVYVCVDVIKNHMLLVSSKVGYL